jgi:hypothetical protein
MNKKAETRTPTYVLLDRADRKRIEQLAAQEGLATSSYIRRLVMHAIQRAAEPESE